MQYRSPSSLPPCAPSSNSSSGVAATSRTRGNSLRFQQSRRRQRSPKAQHDGGEADQAENEAAIVPNGVKQTPRCRPGL